MASSGHLIVRDLNFDNGSAALSGGAIAVEGKLEVYGGVFSKNRAGGAGGAIGGMATCTSTSIDGATFKNNVAAGGAGAVEQEECPLTVTRSTFVANTSDTAGGAVNCNSGTAPCTITASTFTRNSASTYGGGGVSLFNDGPKLITQCTFFDNSATDGGGAVTAFSGVVTISYCTITGNTLVAGAGESASGGIANFFAEVTVTASVVQENLAAGKSSDLAGPISSGGYNHLGSTAGATVTASTGDTLDSVATLGALADNGGPTETRSPDPESAVVDAIPKGEVGCGTTVTSDQRGDARPSGEACDKGAVEL